MDLSVVIVNFNGKEDIPRCLASLRRVRDELAFEVIVVDNGSTDGSCEEAEKSFPEFQYLRAGKNIGFAAACNLGLAVARGRCAMLLNPDTEVLPGALRELVKALDSHPQWGIVGPRMVDGMDRPYPAARRFPTPFFLFCEATRLSFLFPHSRFLAGYFYGDCDTEKLDMVDQVEGSALMISDACRKAIGPLDERFFLFFEEVDWCKRAWGAGFEVHVVQTATVRHHRSTTMARFFTESRIHRARSALKYFHKYYGNKGVKKLKRYMNAALIIREIGMRIAWLFGGGKAALLRAHAARSERKVYRSWLTN